MADVPRPTVCTEFVRSHQSCVEFEQQGNRNVLLDMENRVLHARVEQLEAELATLKGKP